MEERSARPFRPGTGRLPAGKGGNRIARVPNAGGGLADRRRSARFGVFAAASLGAAFLAGCAARPLPDIPAVPVDGWEFAAARSPMPGADLGGREAELAGAWAAVVEGRLGEADAVLARLVEDFGGDPGVRGAAGFAALRGGRPEQAETHFRAATGQAPDRAFAALGRYLTALSLGDADDAFDWLRRLAAVDPEAPAAVERLPSLTLETAERRLATARDLARSDPANPEVASAYAAALEALPSDDLRMEAAEASLAAGETGAAARLYEAVADSGEATERQVVTAAVTAAELLADAGDFEGGADRLERMRERPALVRALARTPGLAERVEALEPRLRAARLPGEYSRIREAERVTREQLAALLAAELGAPEGGGGPGAPVIAPVIAIDLDRSWAADLIRSAVGAGYLTLFPDHTFKPRAFVNRATLAEALAAAFAANDRAGFGAARQRVEDRRFADLPEMHRSREAAAVAVELGLLRTAGDRFRPRDFASGAEAARAVGALRELLESGGR